MSDLSYKCRLTTSRLLLLTNAPCRGIFIHIWLIPFRVIVFVSSRCTSKSSFYAKCTCLNHLLYLNEGSLRLSRKYLIASKFFYFAVTCIVVLSDVSVALISPSHSKNSLKTLILVLERAVKWKEIWFLWRFRLISEPVTIRRCC